MIAERRTISTSEVPGHPTARRNFQVKRNGEVIVEWGKDFLAVSPTMSFSIGEKLTWTNFDAQPGDLLEISVRNEDGVFSDVLFDFGTPER